MTQGIGPEDQVAGETPLPEESGAAEPKRVAAWQWLILALLLLLVIWLIWQYLNSSRAGQSTVVVIKREANLTPSGAGVIAPGNTEDDAAIADQSGPLVPDVVGMTRSAAISAVEAAGYRASVTDVYGSSYPASTVIQQNPTAGARLGEGETVGMLVQLRPSSKPMVTVPRLVGLSQSAAEAKLNAIGAKIVISYFPDASHPGKVKSQWPLAGDRVVKGGDVQIQITVKP